MIKQFHRFKILNYDRSMFVIKLPGCNAEDADRGSESPGFCERSGHSDICERYSTPYPRKFDSFLSVEYSMEYRGILRLL